MNPVWTNAYLWVKTLHLLFVIAWMAAVFYLPRILVNVAEVGAVAPVRDRLLLMGKRLYGFGHVMFGIMLLLGVVLWIGAKHSPTTFPIAISGWLHVKLTLVALLFAYYIVTGRWLKGVAAGKSLPSSKTLRWFNEAPVLLTIVVIFLVLAKPF
jgi:putative membrane protein